MVKNIIQEYYTWQNPDKPGQFSYCQYPFILSIVAKRHILTKVIIILHILNYDNDNDNDNDDPLFARTQSSKWSWLPGGPWFRKWPGIKLHK